MTDLKPAPFGRDGVMVSPVGFGAAGLGNEYGDMDDDAATDIVRYAFDSGITYFDTSAYYGRATSTCISSMTWSSATRPRSPMRPSPRCSNSARRASPGMSA